MPFFILWNENSLKFPSLAKLFYTAFYGRSLFYPRTWELGSECVKIKCILTVLTPKSMWRVLRAQAECEWCVRNSHSVDESLNCIWIDFIRDGCSSQGELLEEWYSYTVHRWNAGRMILIYSSQMKCWKDDTSCTVDGRTAERMVLIHNLQMKCWKDGTHTQSTVEKLEGWYSCTVHRWNALPKMVLTHS